MSVTIGSNILSIRASRQLDRAGDAVARTAERLASGQRINRASDDAAGLAVASALTTSTRVYTQAVRNVADGVSYVSIADGAAEQLTGILHRAKELAAQSANGTYSDTQRQGLDAELSALQAEYNRIIDTTSFNQVGVFAAAGPLVLQMGYGVEETLAVRLAASGTSSTSVSGEIARVSVSGAGGQGNGSSYAISVSSDGRYVVFDSAASSLVAGDTNGATDTFLRDLQTGATTRVSLTNAGGEISDGIFDASQSAGVSGDGRYVLFSTQASTVVAGDANGISADVFLRDRQAGTTTLVSVSSGGVQGNSTSYGDSISRDGRYAVFRSQSSNLVAGDTNGQEDVFLRDFQAGTTTLVSVATGGAQGNSQSYQGSISGDGRYVAFDSYASNLVAGDTNGSSDVFVRDLQAGTTTRVSVTSGGAQGTGTSYNPWITNDGRYVFFNSTSGLVAADTNGTTDIYRHDLQTGQTELVSLSDGGAVGDGYSTLAGSSPVSLDGRYVTFVSVATNLVAGDANGQADIFVRDLLAGRTVRVNTSAAGGEADGSSVYAAISGDGRVVVFDSDATNLVAGDTNGQFDVFRVANALFSASGGGASGLTPLSGLSVATRAQALVTLDALDPYYAEVATVRGAAGTALSRLAAANANLRVRTENTAAAAARITDADVAEEAARRVRETILQEAAAAVLAQANLQPRLALTLLAP